MEPSSLENQYPFLIDYSSFLQNNNNNNNSLVEQFGEQNNYNAQMENSSSSLEMHHEFIHKKRNASDGNSSSSLQSKECKKRKRGKREKIEDKNNPKEEETPKGYIHVRARRGQATDSHSLAERVRREKISARMKTLQGLVPGCDKVMGKALMLDEIINYVQSLQNQVEFLSMKLACMGPTCHGIGLNLYGNIDQIHDAIFDNSSPSKSNVPYSDQEHESHVVEEKQRRLLLSQFLLNHISYS